MWCIIQHAKPIQSIKLLKKKHMVVPYSVEHMWITQRLVKASWEEGGIPAKQSWAENSSKTMRGACVVKEKLAQESRNATVWPQVKYIKALLFLLACSLFLPCICFTGSAGAFLHIYCSCYSKGPVGISIINSYSQRLLFFNRVKMCHRQMSGMQFFSLEWCSSWNPREFG